MTFHNLFGKRVTFVIFFLMKLKIEPKTCNILLKSYLLLIFLFTLIADVALWQFNATQQCSIILISFTLTNSILFVYSQVFVVNSRETKPMKILMCEARLTKQPDNIGIEMRREIKEHKSNFVYLVRL
jgi:hypothetical protein